MAKKKGSPRYTTTRDVYKAAKKYDHQQFDQFCSIIYEEGFKDGKRATPGIEARAVLEAIGSVKGVGPVMNEKISKAISELFDSAAERGR